MHYDEDDRVKREPPTTSDFSMGGTMTTIIILLAIALVGIIYMVSRDNPQDFPVAGPTVIMPLPSEPVAPAAPVLIPTPDPGIADAKRAAEDAARSAQEARDAAKSAEKAPVIESIKPTEE